MILCYFISYFLAKYVFKSKVSELGTDAAMVRKEVKLAWSLEWLWSSFGRRKITWVSFGKVRSLYIQYLRLKHNK